MPRGNRTGPRGLGPMTGRAMGYCAGYPVPGYLNPFGGWGSGLARGYWMGRGGGRGFRRGFWGVPSYGYGYPAYGGYVPWTAPMQQYLVPGTPILRW